MTADSVGDRQGHPAQLMGPLFSQTVLGVLFALTFEKALQVFFDSAAIHTSVSDWWSATQPNLFASVVGLLQLVAFLATLFRFYAGSYRFHHEPPEQITTMGIMVDLAGTAILFVGFYVAALFVGTAGPFLAVVALFHVIDLAWFAIGGTVTTYRRHVQKVVRNYIGYDVVTIVAFGIVWLFVPEAWYPVGTSVVLLLMFCFDMLWHSRDWYFAPPEWAAAHGGTA